MTKPSRSVSHGRLAACGSLSRLVDSALQALNPAIPISEIGASAPPATMTSASPKAISRAASPIAWAPVEQAVTTAWFGPLKPNRIDTCPLTRLMSEPGMKNGDTRLGPRSLISTAVSAIEVSPPIPDPIITPVRSFSSSDGSSQPASRTACTAAAIPYRMKSSTLRRSLGSIQSSGLKLPSLPSPNGISQAYLVTTSFGSKRVIGPAPDCPSRSRVQVSSTPEASGVTIPSPVTTTLRMALLPVFDGRDAYTRVPQGATRGARPASPAAPRLGTRS